MVIREVQDRDFVQLAEMRWTWDFYAVLQIVVPPADTESARVLYNGMAEQFKSFDPRSMPGA